MDIVNRIKSFMSHEGIGNSQFADTCHIARPTLSQILNGRNKKISDEIITKVHIAYPQLSITWLLFGEGPMLTDAITQFSEGVKEGEMPATTTHDADIDPFPPLSSEEKDVSEFKSNNLFDPTDFEAMHNNDDSNSNQISIAPSHMSKKIVHIMVFYSDNTFESVTPA